MKTERDIYGRKLVIIWELSTSTRFIRMQQKARALALSGKAGKTGKGERKPPKSTFKSTQKTFRSTGCAS